MKHSRLAVLLFSAMLSLPAFAAPVTMLQFGSFESREEAEKRLDLVRKKYALQLAGFEASVREVKLPPDGLIVYRTQAGPLPDRASAQTVCTKLAAAGDECYIVQTAMVAAPVVSTPAPAVALNAAPLPVPNLEKATGTPAVEAPSELPSAPAPDITRKLSLMKDIPERDEKSREALANIRVAPTEMPSVSPTVTVAPEEMAPPSPAMQAALDKAAQEQTQNATKVADAVADAERKQPRSFWSRLNPFEDEEPRPAEAVMAHPSAPAAVEKPVVLVPSLDKEPEELAPVAALPNPQETPAPVVAPKPVVKESSPSVIWETEPMQLPPPPAPLKAQNPTPTPEKPAPMVTGAVPASTLPVPQPLPAEDGGRVKVEEAKRVPVTNAPMITQTPLPPPAAQAPAIPSASQVPAPSATLGQKTLWAQIGPFIDGPTATQFWANYRLSHPDFPVVRVRVVSSYQQQQRGKNEAWLRVGPMARGSSVDHLCASLATMRNLQCGQVMDLGVSAGVGNTAGLMPGSRYQR